MSAAWCVKRSQMRTPAEQNQHYSMLLSAFHRPASPNGQTGPKRVASTTTSVTPIQAMASNLLAMASTLV